MIQSSKDPHIPVMTQQNSLQMQNAGEKKKKIKKKMV